MKRSGNGINVMEVETALDSGDDRDLPVGGFEKNHRPARQPTSERPSERPRKNNKRSSATVIQEVSAEKPPEEEKEVNEMKNNSVPVAVATQTRQEFEICPVCGFFNKSVKAAENGENFRYLVCKGCNDKYIVYAKKVANEIAAGKKPEVLSKIEWVLSQLDIERFEKELEAAREMRANTEARINEMIRIAVAGKTLPREVFIELKAKYQQKVSREDYFLVRRLFARLQAARKLKPELEQIIAEAAKKAAETAQTAETTVETAVAALALTT